MEDQSAKYIRDDDCEHCVVVCDWDQSYQCTVSLVVVVVVVALNEYGTWIVNDDDDDDDDWRMCDDYYDYYH